MESADDLFEGIVMSEERYRGEGYEEGFAVGSHVGEAEGKQYGAVYGARAGSELGCYLGFASTWRLLLLSPAAGDKHSKKMKTLDSLIKMIENFPTDDPTHDKLQDELSTIRGKVKQSFVLCNLGQSRCPPKISSTAILLVVRKIHLYIQQANTCINI